QRAEVARLDVARVGTVAREERVRPALPTSRRQERLAEAEQPARRDPPDTVGAAVVAVLHVQQLAAAAARELDDGAERRLRDLDLELLVRLVALAVHDVLDDLGPRDLQLVSLAPQVLDEDREVQLPSPTDDERVRALGVGDAERDVALELGVETLAQLAARHVLAVAAREGAGVHRGRHP